MAVDVFDADVLIGFLNRDDAHHAEAVRRVRGALAPGSRRQVCAVNYSEVLIGPLRRDRADVVRGMIERLGIDVVSVDAALAERAADVRAATDLTLPGAYALATAGMIADRRPDDVVLETFDERVRRAHQRLRRRASG